MISMTQSTDRHSPSYVLVNVELVQAAILPVDSQLLDPIAAELREISQRGAKLLIQGPPRLRYECVVSLASHRLKPTLMLDAEIHWARPNPAGDWLLGCHFKTPLTSELFQQWVDCGVLNRRKSVRERSRIYVGVQLQVGKPRLPAIVSDFSEGGICLITSEAPKNTREVCVFGSLLGEEVCISLKVRWNLSVGPKHIVGCEFARGSDYKILRRMHQATQQGTLTEHSPVRHGANSLDILQHAAR
jgi:hypothetical protein